MAKKNRREPTLSEVLAGLPPSTNAPGGFIPSPADRDEFTDESGFTWQKIRGPIERRLAARLVENADVMIVGWGAGQELRHLATEERGAVWKEIKDRLRTPNIPSYRPFEYASADGLSLLYIEENC
ncbi:hypothetical protein ACFVXG_03930 [Kitasatospora sp. NPDC058162]|uniref:hypothetical protein n=1 Tax=Kitasatospora sp. NPDC058162 TaxID=3346362 RepID=UPI0036DE4603